MQISTKGWVHISGWGARTGTLQSWQCSIATTLASYSAGGWVKILSQKQANQGVKILEQADRNGWRSSSEEDFA
jgi:hypothetical protein